jgi:hypothetical protein
MRKRNIGEMIVSRGKLKVLGEEPAAPMVLCLPQSLMDSSKIYLGPSWKGPMTNFLIYGTYMFISANDKS